MVTEHSMRGRLAELLAAEAAADLSATEREELERLLAPAPAADREQLMRAAGLAQVVFIHGDARAARPLPGALRERLRRQGDAWQAGRNAAAGTTTVADLDVARRRREEVRPATATPSVAAPTPGAATPSAGTASAIGNARSSNPRRGLAGLGWYAAAAVLAAALVLRVLPGPVGAAPDPADRRAALLQAAPDVVRIAWGPSTEAGFASADGDVVWSTERQEGYLRLAGLPPNDPAREQYQLWVVDPDRDARPVDGGVFDVGPGGEVIIPIDAKLRVGRPAAFAITLEKPGGVVVSDGPLLLVAAVSG